jgi:hypothetical protein
MKNARIFTNNIPKQKPVQSGRKENAMQAQTNKTTRVKCSGSVNTAEYNTAFYIVPITGNFLKLKKGEIHES